MKVLLCTPFSNDPQFVQGGIVVWAQNIVDYYHSLSTDLLLKIVPFDRKVKNAKNAGMLNRVWSGISEYKTAVKKTRKQLKKENYDVLHLCTSASISLAKDYFVLKIAKRNGVKTVIHFHFGRIPELVQQNNWEWKLLQKIVKLADAAVTIDRKSFNALQEYGFKNVHYLPNPLSRSIIQQISFEAATTEREERKLCFVGHVIPTKGVFELVEACKEITGIKMHVVGKVTPEVRSQMEQIANGGDWLVFEGEVNHQKVIHVMLTSSVFVLPTYTEGFPNVILESMACGCAIATTPVGAIPEMLDMSSDKPCGLCCEPKDEEGLRHNIQYFLDHPNEAREYGNRAVKRVNEMYAMPKVWEQTVEIWREIAR